MSAAAMDVATLPVHPICDLFPPMDSAQFASFKADISANGLIKPVIVHEGQVVDGRNRLRACQEIGIAPRIAEWREEYSGSMSVAQWIWSTNVERRHLTPDQITAAIVERESITRKPTERKNGRFVKSTVGPNSTPRCNSLETKETEPKSNKVTYRLSKEAGVTTYQIKRAMRIKKNDPDLLRDVAHGKITMAQAAAKIDPDVKPFLRPRKVATETRIKKSFVDALSRVGGVCRGLQEVNIEALRNQCDAKEIKEWANVARSAAKDLRRFAERLSGDEQ